jgi:cytoskeletal protein CcmA (bactofilin family)
MFKGKENNAGASRGMDSGAINTIISGTTIEGNMLIQGSVRFDGHLKGTLECKGRVVIGNSGIVDGNIICNDADITGKVTGNIFAKELTRLSSGSHVKGDIKTGQLAIEPGAVFVGGCSMANEKVKPEAQPAKV